MNFKNKTFIILTLVMLVQTSKANMFCKSLFSKAFAVNQIEMANTNSIFKPESAAVVKSYTLKSQDTQFDSWYLPKATSPWKTFVNSFVHIEDKMSGSLLPQMVLKIEDVKRTHPLINSALTGLQKINEASKYEHGQFIVIFKNANNERFVHLGDVFTSNSKTAIHVNEIDFAIDSIPEQIRKKNGNQRLFIDEVWVVHNHTTLSPLSAADLNLAFHGLYHDQWFGKVTIRMMAVSKDKDILFSKSYIKNPATSDLEIP